MLRQVDMEIPFDTQADLSGLSATECFLPRQGDNAALQMASCRADQFEALAITNSSALMENLPRDGRLSDRDPGRRIETLP